jgi:hypothetical protein
MKKQACAAPQDPQERRPASAGETGPRGTTPGQEFTRSPSGRAGRSGDGLLCRIRGRFGIGVPIFGALSADVVGGALGAVPFSHQRVAGSSPASRVARLLLRRLAPTRLTRAGAQRRSPIVALSPRMSHWFRGPFARFRPLSFGFFRFSVRPGD